MASDSTLASRLAGKFIVFDGPDGCGKSTQLNRFGRLLEQQGGRIVCTRDPGGSAIGDRIRSILLDFDLNKMDVRCETLLFMASRAQLVSEVIEPALADGSTVLCDRFISSTYAYQGAAGYDIGRLMEIGNVAVEDTWPDLTIVLDVPTEVGLSRLQGALDAMESRSRAFHERVRQVMLELPSMYPKPVVVVDGGGDEESVGARIVDVFDHVNW